MDKRWRNLLALLAIVVIAAGAYYYIYLPSQKPSVGISFDEGYAQIKEIWTDVGLSESYLNLNDLGFVDVMTAGQAYSLEETLKDSRAQIAGKNAALESLTSIYSNAAALFGKYKGLSDSFDAEAPLETSQLCGQLAQINSDKGKTINYINSALELSAGIEEFKQNFAAEASKINLSASAFNKTELEKAKADLEQGIADIETFCGAKT